MNIVAIIVNYRTPHLALKCLEALSKEMRLIPALKAILVDNGSSDGSEAILRAAIEQYPLSEWVEFLPLQTNGGFGWANNQAMLDVIRREARPDAFFLLNPDAIVHPGALRSLVDVLIERPDAGAVGSQLLNPDGSRAGSAFRFPTVSREFIRGIGSNRIGKALGIAPILVPYGFRDSVDWVTGASVLLRATALEQAGLFDTGFFLYFEEVELMHRLSKFGWAVYHSPESEVMHIAGASTGVVDGKSAGNRVPPDYVFHSRRRFFALTGGKNAVLLANLAWLAGDGLRQIVSLMLGRRSDMRAKENRALWRTGLRASSRDLSPAFGTFDDGVGELPAWMDA